MSASGDESLWLLPRDEPCAPLEGAARAEVAIVGGGFAGLSAALHLKEERPELDVALVEAGTVGCEASGRNTGMLGPGVWGRISLLRKKFGDEVAARMFRASEDAVSRVVSLVREEDIDCELEETGQLQLATTERQARSLREDARAFASLGFDVPYLEKAQVERAIATDFYAGGLRFERAGLLDPARLCRELKRRLLERGVRVHERTRVRAISPGKPARVELENGALVADQVVVATNALTPRLGLLRGRVVPLHTHVISTEPLSHERRAALGWEGREGIVDARNFFNYYRLTRDDRILFGGGRPLYRASRDDVAAGASVASREKTWEELARELVSIFPALEGLRIERRWSGAMGFTLDRLPVVGELEEARGVLYAGAWCGHGVALATASGAAIADLALRRASARTTLPWIRGSAPWLPPDPLRAIGLGAYLGALSLRDGIDPVGERKKPDAKTRRREGVDFAPSRLRVSNPSMSKGVKT
ncbi:FAD-dependent oxidoreductase [bacterium]|nr:FAD-dependent oxidoreductase [bacterium]